MRTARRTATVVAATLLAGLPAATTTAAAEDSQATQTLNGTWYQGTAQLTPTTCGESTDVSGRWSVTLRKDGTATVSLEVHYQGKLHAAWGGQVTGPLATCRETTTGYVLTRTGGAFDYTLAIDGNDVTFTIPDRYPTCTPPAGTLLGTVR